ncbi:hypothetical protein, partial [Erythrobacter sp.]|uniref:hypothetical protein n=1 Tax=Erythrobacter sp. TaxID=1042 RepID=UPI00311E499F
IYADWMPSAAYLKQGPSGVETVHYEKSAAETVRDAHIKAARRGVRMFAEDIRPVFDLLNPAELRAYNARIWGELCASPPKSLYKMLSAIPHDALAGTRTWKTIGDYWMPNWRYAKPDAKLFPSKRSYRTTYLRRYLKWHLPPSAWRLANKIDAMLRKHI